MSERMASVRGGAVCLALLVGGTVAVGSQAADTKFAYFYVSADPSIFNRVYTLPIEVRCGPCTPDPVLDQYMEAVRQRFAEDPMPYLHHAHVHGPFATRKEAEADRAALIGQSSAEVDSSFMKDFGYSDTVVLELWPAGARDSSGEDLGVRKSAAAALVADAMSGLLLARFTRGFPGEHLDWLTALAKRNAPDLIVVGGELVTDAANRQALASWLSSLNLAAETRVLVVDGTGTARDAAKELQSKLKGSSRAKADRVVYFPPSRQPAGAGRSLELRNRIRQLLRLPVPTLRINELMSSNAAALKDEAGEYDDWVELLNTGSQAVDLAGLYLSDDALVPALWRIPAGNPSATTLAAGKALLVWCDRQPRQGALHAEFRLDSTGEELLLVDVDGKTVLDRIEFPAVPEDRSYGRTTFGWKLLKQPSPGRP